MALIVMLKRLAVAFFLGVAFMVGALFFIARHRCIDFSVLEHYDTGSPSILLDDEGKEWARFELDRREPITLQQMPQHLIQAFIAAEDWNFFNHPGISFKGMIRSMLVNLYHGRKVQGASTITQQLVRLLFFSPEKTFKRKIKEQLYAILVEMQYTKEQILEKYLNHVYLGCGIYGVEAASQRFWGKPARDLTLDESAVLAAIVQSPGNYCPLLYPLSAQKRRNIVLRQMLTVNVISQDEYQKTSALPVTIKPYEHGAIALHLKETIRIMLEEQLGKAVLYTGGLTIQTTLNQQTQCLAEKAFKEQCAKLREKLAPDVDGALISIEVSTGGIKALVGGFDFASSKYNRALQARRQIGSVIKPLIYAAALEAGHTFAETEIDEPFEIVGQNGAVWSPHNYNHEFEGRVTLAHALSHSNNIVAIKTFLANDKQRVAQLAQKCRLNGFIHTYPSLALGCIDGSLKEVVGMFNIFANNGTYVEPHYIRWVKNKWGKKIFKISPDHETVLDSRVSGQVTKVLGLALERVRVLLPQAWIDSEAISKTGTTNECRICWYVGSTPTLTTAVYIGCDDNRSMGAFVFPIRTAFPIWIALHRELHSPQKKFVYDPSLRELIIDEKTGRQLYDLQTPGAITILV